MKRLLKLTAAGTVMCLLLSGKSFAQADLLGGQYIFSKVYVNPSFVGTDGRLNANAYYQMNESGQASNSYTISTDVDGLFANNKSGWGLNLTRSRFGNDSYTVAYANYAYHVDLSSDLKMSSGVGIGFQQFDISMVQLQTVTENDPAAMNNVYSSKLDARAGIRLEYSSKFYGGLSFDNLISVYSNKEDYQYQVPPMFRKINMYALLGANLEYSNGFGFQPSFLFIKTFGGNTAFELNAMLEMAKTITFGIAFRQDIIDLKSTNTSDDHSTQSIIRPLIQYNVSKTNSLKFGYCYSFNTGRPTGVGKGSHDLSVVFNLPVK
ncbi:type IX secretion system membrane protein PorP/SprF [Pedobacter sp. HMF7647]|uniref:Type IX secretion system membrane protein PorP/SprF n=1 Tax=Hufsiella arboris TaxID=2695275 RepID=A0A7K1Y9I7_9SPHI|nr:PorP/SprF family type IX secretion system membrane protein [Hufsiella arboris]MXV51011.1 type IX secretion system membrane protein PorP/SprF [Hufsiella arboris]